MNRRDFLLHSALASAGLALTVDPMQALAWTSPRGGDGFGLGLAPRVALADALHLAAADQATPADIRAVLADYAQLAIASDAVEATPAEVVGLLGELRTLWPDRDHEPDERQGVRGDMAEQRLAWAVGRLAHNAIAGVLGQPGESEMRARDGVLLRALHEVAPASPPDLAALADLFRVIDQRTAIRLHTYQPDLGDVGGWVGRIVAWDRERYAEADRLATAVLGGAPNPAFLDPRDPAFRLARAARQARPVPPAALAAAVEMPGASAYARAVGSALGVIREVGKFFAGTLDANSLLTFLARS